MDYLEYNEYRVQFMESLIQKENLSKASVQTYKTFWERVAKAEAEMGKPLDAGYTREEYISLFEKLKITSVFVLAPYKSYIGKYLKWLNGLGVLDQKFADNMYGIMYEDIKPDAIFESKYFRDFDSLQKAIIDTLWAAGRVDDRVFATQISAIYLAWCGVKMEELLQIKKADVHENSITVGEREIKPPSSIMEYIKDYRDATEYQSQARGIITLKYETSELLFRTVRSDHIGATKALRIFIRNFGKNGAKDDKNIFTYDKVYWSGIFNRAYIYECLNGSINAGEKEKIERIFQESYVSVGVANKRLREYQRFKQYFYPNCKTRTE